MNWKNFFQRAAGLTAGIVALPQLAVPKERPYIYHNFIIKAEQIVVLGPISASKLSPREIMDIYYQTGHLFYPRHPLVVPQYEVMSWTQSN